MYKGFDNKVALITGGASGLGLAIARKLAAYNVKLALFDSNKNSLDKIKSGFSTEVECYVVNVASEGEVKKLPMKLTSKTDFMSSYSTSWVLVLVFPVIPAQLMSMSMEPNCLATLSTAAFTSPSDATLTT